MTYVTRMRYWELTRWRAECHERFGANINLPIVKSYYDECRRLLPKSAVLDVGGGRRHTLKQFLHLSDEQYHSLDTDPEGGHTYLDFDDIPADNRFDLVTMNQLLEHLTVDDAHDLLVQVRRLIQPGGHLVIGVPNAAHPTRYASDVTHVSNWNAGHLYGIVRHIGFEIDLLARCNKRRLTLNPLRRWVVRTVCREFRIDWCDTLVLVARAPSD